MASNKACGVRWAEIFFKEKYPSEKLSFDQKTTFVQKKIVALNIRRATKPFLRAPMPFFDYFHH